MVKHLTFQGLLPDKHYRFRLSRSTVEVLTDIAERVCHFFHKNAKVRIVALKTPANHLIRANVGLLDFYKLFGKELQALIYYELG